MTMQDKVIAVVDDHPLIAKALGELLSLRGYETPVFYNFFNFREWLDGGGEADLCIIDYSLPDIEGDDILPNLRGHREELSIAIWSGREDPGLAEAVIRQGAVGFISKGVSITTIPPAIDLMLAGEIFVSNHGRSDVFCASLRSQPAAPAPERAGPSAVQLTPREQDVMDLLLQGLSNKEIAARLTLNPVTVKLHNRNIYRKLRVRNRTEATLRYLELTAGLTLQGSA